MNFDRHARLALIVASLTLLLGGAGFHIMVAAANAYLEKQPVALRHEMTTLPRQLGEWQARGADQKLTAEVEESLGTDKYLDRWYIRETDGREESINVHMAYYTGFIDTVPHVADRCLAAHGWVAETAAPTNLPLPVDRDRWVPDPDHANLRTGEPYPLLTFTHHITGDLVRVRMPLGDFRLRTTRFRAADRPDVRIFAGYLFIANGHTVPRPEGVRKFAFDLTTRYAYYAKLQFTYAASEQTDEKQFVAVVTDLVNELLPELMLCLPDWAEIENQGTGEGEV